MWILIVLLVIIALVAFGVMSLYNGLVRSRNKVEAAWSQIDVQLTRRHDLIPNLVNTVKGYASHEQDTLDAVISARNAGVSAQGPAAQAEAEGGISQALGRLFALSEAYPDLKANQNFMELQGELTSSEDRIAYARQFYNDTVRTYNDKTQSVPSNLLAGPFGFRAREYFETDPGSRGPVSVEF